MTAAKAVVMSDAAIALPLVLCSDVFQSSSDRTPQLRPQMRDSKALFAQIATSSESGEDIALISQLVAVGLLFNQPNFPYSDAFEEYSIPRVLVGCLSEFSSEDLQTVAVEVVISALVLQDRLHVELLGTRARGIPSG
jgi:hypothetical protein